jgi:hypothetical protein
MATRKSRLFGADGPHLDHGTLTAKVASARKETDMKTNRVFGVALGVMMGASSLAFADNVVIQPSGGAAAPAPAPAAVVPTAVQPVAAQPAVVDVEPSHRAVVRADVSPPHNYMATIAGSAFLGAAAGALIGGAIYFLDNQSHPYNIAYWAAGGVLVGTGVGLTQILVQESRASQATALQSDPAPTLRLALFHTQF